jgi:hypothetical protein
MAVNVKVSQENSRRTVGRNNDYGGDRKTGERQDAEEKEDN